MDDWKNERRPMWWHIAHTLFPAFGLSTVSPIGNASPFGIRYGPSDLLRREGVPRSPDWNINRKMLVVFVFLLLLPPHFLYPADLSTNCRKAIQFPFATNQKFTSVFTHHLNVSQLNSWIVFILLNYKWNLHELCRCMCAHSYHFSSSCRKLKIHGFCTLVRGTSYVLAMVAHWLYLQVCNKSSMS